MVLLWASLAVFLVALSGILFIVIRKLPLLAALQIAETPKHVEEKKSFLMEERLKRKFTSLWGNVRERTKPLAGKTSGLLTRAQKSLVDLEQEYKIRSLPVFLNRRQRQTVNAEIQAFLNQAEALMNDDEQAAAEEKCLQAIRYEPRSVPSFELLGEIYARRKEWGHAKEVYLYLEKLLQEHDAILDHRPLAEREPEGEGVTKEQRQTLFRDRLIQCYCELQDWPNAFSMIEQALRDEPNSPKILDQYIDIALLYGKKSFAAEGLEKLKSVNPENSKIAEWEEKIAALDEVPPQNET